MESSVIQLYSLRSYFTLIYTQKLFVPLHQFIISHFGGIPLVILVDLLNGSIGVEGVALFLTIGDLSGTLDDVFGRDAIVGLRDSFLSTAGVV